MSLVDAARVAHIEEELRQEREAVEKARRRARQLDAALRVTVAERDAAAERAALTQRMYDEALKLRPQPKWLRHSPGHTSGTAALVAFLSDVHAGEIVRPEEMGGVNAYNLRIADLRLKRFFDRIITLSRDYFAGVTYTGIVLNLGGDLVSGDIHDELEQTNELSVLDTTLWLAPRILAGIAALAEVFPSVHVVSQPGNHGRDSKLPRFKGRSAHNADTHIARMVAMYWSQQNPSSSSVTFDIPESYDADFRLFGTRFTAEHGENLQKNNPGTSEIGSLGPVKRGSLRKARAKLEQGQPFDVMLVAHFHQLVYAPSQGFVMNGSLKGYDEYAKGLNLKPEPPQQALFVVTPEHGPTMHAPILVMDRKAEGW